MRGLVDENIPRITVDFLRGCGHDVKDIRGTAGEGLADDLLWRIALTERRVLITTDKGFTAYRGAPHFGILVVRLRQPNRLKIHQSALLAHERFRQADWPGLLVVVRMPQSAHRKPAARSRSSHDLAHPR